ncbi:hypothetical protein [Pontibacterium sp.]|uniref:hypothetical protein n=1 Tax=Pontibacterium sp. TaxID=2036026 RepID=UPI0035128960
MKARISLFLSAFSLAVFCSEATVFSEEWRSNTTPYMQLATHYLDSKELYEGHEGEGIPLYKPDDVYDPELYRFRR